MGEVAPWDVNVRSGFEPGLQAQRLFGVGAILYQHLYLAAFLYERDHRTEDRACRNVPRPGAWHIFCRDGGDAQE